MNKKFLENNNQIFEFGNICNLTYKNLDAFGGNYDILQKIQDVYSSLYTCYYEKADLKSLDFHFIWNCYLDVKKVKLRVIEDIKCFDIREDLVLDGNYGKMFINERKILDGIIRLLAGWMSSNIKHEDVEGLLNEAFQMKNRKMQNKWLIGMNRKKIVGNYHKYSK